ncbi:hypothetical protein D9C73_006954 [Collichthys lucidus]|uniref:Uncharacterized protein n=1 Tax=Collichthys lucidus TaxID=240159 RepID=A0A4U5UE84_COLLU|nr:hypothetical protein D9C73_006954 [Collichthys lucidus]
MIVMIRLFVLPDRDYVQVLDSLCGRLRDYVQVLDSLQGRHRNYVQVLDSLQGRHRNYVQVLDSLCGRHRNYVQVLDSLRGRHGDYVPVLDSLQGRHRDYVQVLDSLRGRLRDYVQVLDSLCGRLRDYVQVLDSLRGRRRDYVRVLDSLRGRHRDYVQVLDSLCGLKNCPGVSRRHGVGTSEASSPTELRTAFPAERRGRHAAAVVDAPSETPPPTTARDTQSSLSLAMSSEQRVPVFVPTGVTDYQEEEEEVTRLSSFYGHDGRGAESKEDADGGS